MSDNMVLRDINIQSDGLSIPNKPIVRTDVICGYDAYKDKNGITQFGEIVFRKPNMIVLGGSLYTLFRLFGVTSDLTVANLEDIYSDVKLENELSPSTDAINNKHICLFGVGSGGCGEVSTNVYPVKYHSRELDSMIPLRQTANALSTEDASKYWFKRKVTVNGVQKTAYMLKTFEYTPEIKVLWRDGELGADGERADGSEVGNDVHTTPDSNTTGIDTFVEIVLKISINDIREYYNDLGSIDQARFNTIGLFTGTKTKLFSDQEVYDYRSVKLFSKLNFNNEMLVLRKDLTVSYRIYTS
jgi:hypothetical protein